LIERRRFDAALLDDARAAGVDIRLGAIAKVEDEASGWRVAYRAEDGAGTEVVGDFLVEARGRRAPAGSAGRSHGPASVALVGFWQGRGGEPTMGSVAAFPDGWAWFAAPGEGVAALQVMVGGERLPGRGALDAFYRERVAEVAEAPEWLAGAEPDGEVVARNADVMMAQAPLGQRWIRIGDAAAALDPLSGHGQFAAVSTALNAVPVVATLRERPADAALAERFYTQRVEAGFAAMGRVGRDFYRIESRWPERPFWAERRVWPDDAPAHADPASRAPEIASRPVICDGYVCEREVVVTADFPRGVWQVAGVSLVPLMRFLDDAWRPAEDVVVAAAGHFACPPEAAEKALGWLSHRGLLVARQSETS
jgi:flavin-dependent dehydrogenase